jgi:Na+-transporting NADH:ubiquinone oxidoreductase subunit NqrB
VKSLEDDRPHVLPCYLHGSLLQRVDARWFVLVNNTALLVLGLAFFELQRDAVQIVTCFFAAVASELVAARVSAKHRDARLSDRALSAATAAASTLILLRSPYEWFYALVVTIAIASKYVVLDARGRHVFNPTNFAIVFAVAFLPDYLFVRPDQFSGSPWLMAQIVLFGLLAIVRGARYRTTLGYYATVFLVGVPTGVALGLKPLWILVPELDVATLIFAFLMMTDPRTTPERPSFQWAFGAAVAAVHLSLRYMQVPYSPFIALFVVAGLRSAWAKGPAPAAATRVDHAALRADVPSPPSL